jgi:hypothetical protein
MTYYYLRRHSFSAGDEFPSVRVLPVDYMRIDVELCGQLIIMRRREEHLGNLVTCLEVSFIIVSSLYVNSFH